MKKLIFLLCIAISHKVLSQNESYQEMQAKQAAQKKAQEQKHQEVIKKFHEEEDRKRKVENQRNLEAQSYNYRIKQHNDSINIAEQKKKEYASAKEQSFHDSTNAIVNTRSIFPFDTLDKYMASRGYLDVEDLSTIKAEKRKDQRVKMMNKTFCSGKKYSIVYSAKAVHPLLTTNECRLLINAKYGITIYALRHDTRRAVEVITPDAILEKIENITSENIEIVFIIVKEINKPEWSFQQGELRLICKILSARQVK